MMIPKVEVTPKTLALAASLLWGACSQDAEHEGTALPEPAAEAQRTEPKVAPAKSPDDARREELRSQAKALTDAFQARLKERLTSAMQEGGPAAALEVCKVDAPKIAAALPGEQGKEQWSVGRTSHRVRNPDNAPTGWQRAQLETFAARIDQAPELEIASLEWDAVAKVDGQRQWRYMRAIPMGGVCMTCHGAAEALPPPVKTKLAELYPDDQATGFAKGELRGAFVVTAPF